MNCVVPSKLHLGEQIFSYPANCLHFHVINVEWIWFVNFTRNHMYLCNEFIRKCDWNKLVCQTIIEDTKAAISLLWSIRTCFGLNFWFKIRLRQSNFECVPANKLSECGEKSDIVSLFTYISEYSKNMIQIDIGTCLFVV